MRHWTLLAAGSWLIVGAGWGGGGTLAAAEGSSAIGREYVEVAQPLLKSFCYDCHAGDTIEAELDLASFATDADVRRQPAVWVKIRDVLTTGDMPPPLGEQPTDGQRAELLGWVRALLAEEARVHAGDPGPVALRRLDNAEYNYVLRDLTGMASLDLTHEFPVDGAAGEGFTNVGSGQGMSPAMVQKYLDAAKAAAEHLELLPDGVRFTEAVTQRDRTDVLLARIQEFYRRFTADGGGTAVNLQGIKFETNQGGLLPLERYLAATLEARDALRSGATTTDAVAAERGLSPRYLATLWRALNGSADDSAAATGTLVGRLRQRWLQSGPGDAAALVQLIAPASEALWKFNPVGQIAPGGKPRRWMEPVSPLVGSRELRVKLAGAGPRGEAVITLSVDDAGDGGEQDVIVWERPRLEFAAAEGEAPAPAVLLRDLRPVCEAVNRLQASELPRTARYLLALSTAYSGGGTLEELAAAEGLSLPLLERWAGLTGIAGGGAPAIKGLFTQKNAKVQGYDALNGWGRPETPSMLTNNSDQPLTISTLTVPAHGLTVHPSPTLEAFVAWRSPVAARFTIDGLVADADDKCGNGAAWRLEHHTAGAATTLAEGVIDNGKDGVLSADEARDVRVGDVIVLAIGPRDGNHSCDTTHVELKLTEVGGEEREWDLAGDVVARILEGNPLADRQGHAEVWSFGSREFQASIGGGLPRESALAEWRAAVTAGEEADLAAAAAERLQTLLAASDPGPLAEGDAALRKRLLDWKGPLRWVSIAQQSSGADAAAANDDSYGLDPAAFGSSPSGDAVAAADLCRRAPQRIDVRVPAALVEGAEFVTEVKLHLQSGGEGSVHVAAALNVEQPPQPGLADPILVLPGSAAEQRWNAACEQFRNLFPRALCYARIVPVDEVVTLTLFFREDDHLQRLMLDEAQTAELDRLWDELLFVSEEPLKLVVALEQIREFATQDRPDLVTVFDPLKEPVGKRAEAFRQRQLEAEPAQVEGVIRFAASAWRRPLTEAEQRSLRDFYAHLRSDELPHVEAVKLTFARVLTSPEFLFKLERSPEGTVAAAVSSRELANRLSFFLWSSVPDEPLLAAAEAGQLETDAGLVEEARRMLGDPRARRLAVHFACQWLHLRDFAHNDEKNESLFPEFAALRGPMEEEAVLFFEDLFRHNGSVLGILTADHTFVNESMAGLYGLDWPADAADGPAADGWRRVDGMTAIDRGGVLGMAAVLASQSGASRTSPILRGNWVYETLLGEKLPKPPPGVPQLPELVPEGLTARQLIEQHSSAESCARCHVKIDPYGFALEQFDPVGRSRPERVDTKTTLMDGRPVEGLDGLRSYLANERRDDFVRNFCRKLLGYALGREIQLSDEPLLDEMQTRLKAGDYRVWIAVEAIVSSPQFRRIRGASFGANE